MTEHPSYRYAKDVVNGKAPAPKYVIKQCKKFIDIADGKNDKYIIDEHKVEIIGNLLKLLKMPRGLKAGQSLYECSVGYQWLLYISVLCVVYRKNKNKRRYETALLEIARKNFKTYTTATVFILLFIMEPKFSKFYSVAPDGSLSREIKQAIEETLKSSPAIYKRKKGDKQVARFKMLRDYIKFIPNENKYVPLNYSTSRMDGKMPSVYLADEVGALPTSYPIEAMRSGQLNVFNKLGFIISTKYPSINNPFEDEVAYSKRVLDDIEKDDTVFALLYEPDDITEWATDDNILRQSNPVANEIPEIWDDLLKKRARAIAMPNARENFLTKHCNIIYQGMGTESFVDINDVQACRTNHIEWDGRDVYIGVDLAMTNDNCAVAIVSADDDNTILADAVAFIPDGRIEEKNNFEKINYNEFIEACKCIACGNRTVDYAVIEEFVFKIEEKYGVNVVALGYDRYNALSSAQKWERGADINGHHYEPINSVIVRQASDTLHPVTKLLYEKIANHEFLYETNKLYEINFENARCVYDSNMNRYINKKKSNGKIDMVMATLNALYLLNLDKLLDNDFTVQMA